MQGLRDVVRAAGGVARTSTLRRAGASARMLRTAVSRGDLLKPRQGLYALPATDARIIEAARHGGVPGCVSAAASHGLWVLREDSIHIWMGRAGNARSHSSCVCRLHWDDGVPCIGRLPSVPHTLLQVARCAGAETFFAALESALRQGKIGQGECASLRRLVPAEMRWLVDFARNDADSGLESLVRLRLHKCGVVVQCQVAVCGTGVVDFLIGDRLILEIDGRENHASADRRHKDLVRDASSASWGYETLRFDYAMVLFEWDLVEAAILGKIDARAHVRAV